jgi:hypothetical protein
VLNISNYLFYFLNHEIAIIIIIFVILIKQFFVLKNILNTNKFLFCKKNEHMSNTFDDIYFYIIIPVLREASEIKETVKHFEMITKDFNVVIIVVTTMREIIESSIYPNVENTISIANELASSGRIIHLHYVNSLGVKADQINFAVKYCVTSLNVEVLAEQKFILIYDADSRPAKDSLVSFGKAIKQYPNVDIFHQSSQFELRIMEKYKGILSKLYCSLAHAEALRANRYVFAYEIPRLRNRLNPPNLWQQIISRLKYVHITGHGLCIRMNFLSQLPFPRGVTLEDMHYSFILCSLKVPIVVVADLDRASVSKSIFIRFKQLTRWFYGPGRFLQYLADIRVKRNIETYLITLNAAYAAIEWMLCSILPFFLILLFIKNGFLIKIIIATIILIYTFQLLIIKTSLNYYKDTHSIDLLMYPIALVMFGIAGIFGCWSLISGVYITGKTERD